MRTLAALLLMTVAASAQQQPDPVFLVKALTFVQQQRNYALDMQASAEAREAVLKEEAAKLKAAAAACPTPVPPDSGPPH